MGEREERSVEDKVRRGRGASPGIMWERRLWEQLFRKERQSKVSYCTEGVYSHDIHYLPPSTR